MSDPRRSKSSSVLSMRLGFLTARFSGSKVHPRLRVPHPDGKPSAEVVLPKDVPVDYFEPTLFNQFPISVRANYREQLGIALPLHPDIYGNQNLINADWTKMSSEELLKKYDKDVLAQYNFATSADRDRMEKVWNVFEENKFVNLEELDGMEIDPAVPVAAPVAGPSRRGGRGAGAGGTPK